MSCKRKCAGLGMCAATCTPRAHARQSEAETESRSCCKKLASSLARRASTHLLVLRAAELNDALGCGVAHVNLAQNGVACRSSRNSSRHLVKPGCNTAAKKQQQQQPCPEKQAGSRPWQLHRPGASIAAAMCARTVVCQHDAAIGVQQHFEHGSGPQRCAHNVRHRLHAGWQCRSEAAAAAGR